MDKKKAILKKYTGQGGPIFDKVKNTVKGIGSGYNKIKDKVQSGITNGIVKFVGDTPAGGMLKSGLEAQKAAKIKGAINGSINRSSVAPLKKAMPEQATMRKLMPMPKMKDSMPLPKIKMPAKPGEPWMQKGYKPGSIKRGYTRYG